ncbi:unnamed protein product [Protopolystoma xenopodis]|uniref:Uncharacterized protein n=1 Tax=Protopolystoma xenopodis TaxID=117903 RepID=A0A3S4ZWZ0_9PLAT|nr:unnamed protein product [Protopolystoma xenopodis]
MCQAKRALVEWNVNGTSALLSRSTASRYHTILAMLLFYPYLVRPTDNQEEISKASGPAKLHDVLHREPDSTSIPSIKSLTSYVENQIYFAI